MHIFLKKDKEMKNNEP